jgi:ABC-type branched-subunit amino acid transport system substrate-binding protein
MPCIPRTLKNVTELIDAQSVFALISPMGTANTAALLPLIEGKGIPTVGPITGAPSVRSPEQRNLFFVRPSYADEARRLVQQMVDMGLRRIAVVYLDNPFGKEVLGYLSAALDGRRWSVAGAFALAVDGKNGEEVAEKVYADRPGAVVLATTGTANSAFVLPFRARARPCRWQAAGDALCLRVAQARGRYAGMAAVRVFPDATSAKSVVVRKTSMKSAGAKPEYLTSGSSLEGWINASADRRSAQRERGPQSRAPARRAGGHSLAVLW